MGQITPQKLANLPEVDIWVQICEQRNVLGLDNENNFGLDSTFDSSEFYTPIASFRELLCALEPEKYNFLDSNFDFDKLLPDDQYLKVEENLVRIKLGED